MPNPNSGAEVARGRIDISLGQEGHSFKPCLYSKTMAVPSDAAVCK